jgi:uncharacterized protein
LVSADRAAQQSGEAAASCIDAARNHIRAALDYLKVGPPQLVAVGGLSGTGKTTVASGIAPWLGRAPGAVHLRTDVERKRIAGVDELRRLSVASYAPECRKRVYQVIAEKARTTLEAGQSVIVDAVFADPAARQDMQVVARQTGARFAGLWLRADLGELLKRVAARQNDASDATAEVVNRQFAVAPGPFAAEWSTIEAGGTLQETLAAAGAALSMSELPYDDPQS